MCLNGHYSQAPNLFSYIAIHFNLWNVDTLLFYIVDRKLCSGPLYNQQITSLVLKGYMYNLTFIVSASIAMCCTCWHDQLQLNYLRSGQMKLSSIAITFGNCLVYIQWSFSALLHGSKQLNAFVTWCLMWLGYCSTWFIVKAQYCM